MKSAIFVLVLVFGVAMGEEQTKDCNTIVCGDHYYYPLCATDGISGLVTFNNSCYLSKYKCEHPGTIMKVVFRGDCNEGPIQNCSTVVCENKINHPICVTDGVSDPITFENYCFFGKYKCQHPNTDMTVLFEGDCNGGPTQSYCSTIFCDANYYHPMCATDGVSDPMTFQNYCFFGKYKCMHPGTVLIVLHYGECD